MTRPNQIDRNFAISDSEMIVASGVYRTLFIEDKADFIQFDASFADPYADSWGAAITLAETISQDAELIDQMAQLTAIVNAKMKEAQDYYHKAKYYMEKAFPNNAPIQNEFGRNDYDKARNSTPKLVTFMQALSTAITKYETQLLAAGCTQEFMDEAENVLDDLRSAENNQEVFKKTRPVETQARLQSMNSCWNYSKDVCRAGKIIYSNNAAKYNQYILPGEPQQVTPEPE